MRHIETFTKGSKDPPNIIYFKKPLIQPRFYPHLIMTKNYKKPLFRRDHIFGRGAAKLFHEGGLCYDRANYIRNSNFAY